MGARDHRQERSYKPVTVSDATKRLLNRWIQARRQQLAARRFGMPMEVDMGGDVEVYLREGYGGPTRSPTIRHVEL